LTAHYNLTKKTPLQPRKAEHTQTPKSAEKFKKKTHQNYLAGGKDGVKIGLEDTEGRYLNNHAAPGLVGRGSDKFLLAAG